MRRVLLLAFSLLMVIGGAYFLIVSLQHPTPYGMLRATLPAVFWIGLGAFLLWDDFLRPGKSKP
jgi:hypothetical protein